MTATGGRAGSEQRIIESIEPRQLGLGDLYHRLNEAIIVSEAASGRIVLWNEACSRLFGYTSEEALGRSIEMLVPDELMQSHRSGIDHFLREGHEQFLDSGTRIEVPVVCKDGTRLQVRLTLTAISSDALPGRYAMAVIRDVTENRRAEEELRTAHEELSATVVQLQRRTHELTLIRELGDLLASCRTTDEFSDIVRQMASQLFPTESGCLHLIAPSRNELEMTACWGTESQVSFAPDDCWGLRQGRVHIVGADGVGPRCRHVDSTAIQYLCVPMVAQGETIGLFHLWRPENDPSDSVDEISTLRELAISVAEHIALKVANFRLHEDLRNQAIRDPLTGLYNRRYAEESLDRELHRATRHEIQVGVVMIDIDHFKLINDSFGHETGDAFLCAIAEFFHLQLRGEDIACHYGGDEFLLVLPDITHDEVCARAEDFRQGVSGLFVVPRNTHAKQSVTISLGVATYPQQGSMAADLVRAADTALYRAKADGRDRAVVATHPTR